MHRRSLQVAGSLPHADPDTTYAVVNCHLKLGPRFELDFGSASRWDITPPFPESILPSAQLGDRIPAAWSLLSGLPWPAGFGVLLRQILRLAGMPVVSSPVVSPGLVARHAWPVVRSIVEAILDGDLLSALQRAHDLIGLGEGLTPSGDDFVRGLVFVIGALSRKHVLPIHLEPAGFDDFLQKSKPHTSLISYTLLRDHAFGHACEDLHRLVHALLTGQAPDCIGRLAARLIRVGHSTGWDTLTGVVVGMLAAFDMGRLAASTSAMDEEGRSDGHQAANPVRQ